MFQYSLTGKDGSGSGFGSWKTVPAVPVPLSVSGKTVPTVPVSGSGSVPEPPCQEEIPGLPAWDGFEVSPKLSEQVLREQTGVSGSLEISLQFLLSRETLLCKHEGSHRGQEFLAEFVRFCPHELSTYSWSHKVLLGETVLGKSYSENPFLVMVYLLFPSSASPEYFENPGANPCESSVCTKKFA